MSSQLAIYKELGVLSANVEAALKLTGMPKPAEDGAQERERVLIFTGQQPGASLNDGHFTAEAPEHLSEFQGDITAAQY